VSRIKVGRKTNIQDGCILHGAALPRQLDVEVGDYVNIGHKAIIHGCKIGNNAFIGMSTVILNGAQIGEGSIIGACSLVTQGKEIPPNVLVMGSPAKVIRPVTEEDRQWAKRVNEAYFQRGRYYSEFVKPVEVKPVDRG
jgi:carbonic anhydrase/acetyltransferase-like protein (isoleucine patch superfamily)